MSRSYPSESRANIPDLSRQTSFQQPKHPVLLVLLAASIVLAACLSPRLEHPQAETTKFVNEQLVPRNALLIPPQLEPQMENGEKVFDLTIQPDEAEILPGKSTKIWSYNGISPGPTLRVHTGDKVRLNITNELGETTTVHWHGMELPAAMDGGPHQTIGPGETWRPYWTITNEAATLWYHPHTMGKTAEQVYRGLAGFFLIDDENSDSLALPKEYGVDDIPLVVQDKLFDPGGQFVYPHEQKAITAGLLGDTILVNSTYAPYIEVPAKLVRLRLLNGSAARRYNFGFSDDRAFYQIATDGGLLDAPVERTRLLLSPGERAEILVDLSNTKEPVMLMSYAFVDSENAARNAIQEQLAGGTDEGQQFKILELRPKMGTYAAEKVPNVLNTIERFDEKKVVKTRRFVLEAFTINGKMMDDKRIDEVVGKGDTEIWEVKNNSPIYHAFHIHGVQFQVLDRNGMEPPAYEQGWKDTVTVTPQETVRLIIRFQEYSDPAMPYMFHCHNLTHEDMGMMGQFVVVDNPSEQTQLRSPLPEMNEGIHSDHQN
ncbi:MAG TPA: multicopper oxidase domain-containing protein [Anaerolineales bacterium]|nr:multicopper oxidase domain-containing protein [Anaerolineales bacterium]